MRLRNKIIYSLTIVGIILIFLQFTNVIYFSGDTLQINFDFSQYNIFGVSSFLFLMYVFIFIVIMIVIFEMVKD
jgi:hypothetical protein